MREFHLGRWTFGKLMPYFTIILNFITTHTIEIGFEQVISKDEWGVTGVIHTTSNQDMLVHTHTTQGNKLNSMYTILWKQL